MHKAEDSDPNQDIDDAHTSAVVLAGIILGDAVLISGRCVNPNKIMSV